MCVCISIGKIISVSFRSLRSTYLWPLWIEPTGFFGILQSGLVLAQFEERSWPVTVQDAVLWIGLQSLAVQTHGLLEVTPLTCLIALSHFLHELCLAEATPRPVVPDNAPNRPSRCPRAKDGKLEKRAENNKMGIIGKKCEQTQHGRFIFPKSSGGTHFVNEGLVPKSILRNSQPLLSQPLLSTTETPNKLAWMCYALVISCLNGHWQKQQLKWEGMLMKESIKEV